MLLKHIERHSLVFLGGKGGVGKTTLASSLAVQAAGKGKQVLLASTDPAHNLGHIFERPIGSTPVQVAPRLRVVELDPAECARAHLEQVRQFLCEMMPAESRPEINRHIERSTHAPGMEEAALLERLADLAREIDTGTITQMIVDTAPTGHTLSLLSLPELMTAWVDGMLANRREADRFASRARAITGAKDSPVAQRDERIHHVLAHRREKLAKLRDRLTDTEKTAFLVALLPERMPVLETIALTNSLRTAGIHVPAFVANRMRDDTRSASQAQALARLQEQFPQTPIFTLPEQPAEPAGRADLQSLVFSRLAGD